MNREISAWMATALVLALAIIAWLIFRVVDQARHPVVYIGPNQTFDMKSGKAIPLGASRPPP
jgi:hypothetical protein